MATASHHIGIAMFLKHINAANEVYSQIINFSARIAGDRPKTQIAKCELED
ncbi:MAG TPA: hypothetical protein VHF28_05915 [Nitrososphaera sp.]|nr:hypothetical protein [Nitrososphaera sp.]